MSLVISSFSFAAMAQSQIVNGKMVGANSAPVPMGTASGVTEGRQRLTQEQINKIKEDLAKKGVNPDSISNLNLSPNATLLNGNSALKIEDESTLERKALSSKGIFQSSGMRDKNEELLEGYAKNLPLVEVLKQILPEGWKATAVKNADINQKVSWQGGQSWDKTLEKVTIENGLYIHLNWNEKTVRVLDNSQLAAIHRSREKVAVIDFGNAVNPGVVGNVASVAPNQRWVITNGSLKENLEVWAEQNKFKLVYPEQVANYSLDPFEVTSDGRLDGENGALANLASYFVEGKVKQPLEFDYKTGGSMPVLVIKNRNYEQKFFKENGKPASDVEQ